MADSAGVMAPPPFRDEASPPAAADLLLQPPGLQGNSEQTPGPVEGFIRATLSMADNNLEEKATKLWKAAENRLTQLEQLHTQKTDKLEEELRRNVAKTEALEEDKAQLDRNIAALQERL